MFASVTSLNLKAGRVRLINATRDGALEKHSNMGLFYPPNIRLARFVKGSNKPHED